MSTPVETIRQDAGALAAADKMAAKNLLHLVVVDTKGRIVGVLSDRDLRSAQPSVLLVPDAAMRRKALGMVRVEDVMTVHPSTIRDDQSVEDALGVIMRHRLGCLPVVDRTGELVGIVTSGDVAKLALALVRAHGDEELPTSSSLRPHKSP
jgi:acetoin utilization protein AcuB